MFEQRLRGDAPGERGQTLILVGVLMLVLLGVGAMAVDVGGIMWSRGTQQNAADAAALAGVRALPETPDVAKQVARDYAEHNGFTNGEDGVTVTTEVFKKFNENDSLRVTITRVVPPGLRAAVGAGDITVPAQAVAIVAPSIPMCDIWPWGIEDDTLVYGEDGEVYNTGEGGLPFGKKVVLKVPPQDQVQPGNFLALRLGDGTAASDYRDDIKFGACIDNTETVDTKPGDMSGPTRQGVLTHSDSAIKQCDPCYDPIEQAPDSVIWQVSVDNPYTSGFLDPITHLPYQTTAAFANGCPCGNDCGNTGPPSQEDPFPAVVLPSTTRVGIVPILEKGTWDEASGNNGSFTANIDSFAAFYLIGLEDGGPGGNVWVVGSFLEKVWVKGGTPDFGGELTGPVGAFLWQ